MNTRVSIACDDCGLVHRWRSLAADERACCTRCRRVLYRWHGDAPGVRAGTMAAVSLAALLMYAVAQCSPIVTLDVRGMRSMVSLWQAVSVLWGSAYRVVAVLVGLCAIVFPLLEIGLLLYVACGLARGRRLPGVDLALRVALAARHWAMTDVLMLGILVALVKLVSLSHVVPHLGLFAFAILTVLHTWVRHFEPEELLRAAGRRSDDGAPPMSARGHKGIASTWVLLALAALLYVPANLLPVMVTRTIGGTEGDTILDGVAHFWHGGSPGLALIVLVASVVVPVSKLAALAWLNLMAQLRSRRAPLARMRVYRAVEFIGRWSMLDVFAVTLTVALVRFDALVVVTPGPGALAFCCVVVLTMVASARFDPRLIWPHPDEPCHV